MLSRIVYTLAVRPQSAAIQNGSGGRAIELSGQSTPESVARAGFDGHKKRKGSKVHAPVDTLGHLLALKVTPANEQDRAQVADLSRAVQEANGQNVQVAFVDQGCTGEEPAMAAAEQGIELEVVKHHEAK